MSDFKQNVRLWHRGIPSNMVNAAQLRAARVWLEMSQDAVAAEVGLTRGTIIRLEKDPSAVQPRTVRDVRKLYEARGIQFVFRDDGVGIGILKDPPE
ncbi:helix-turn-helix domain-containing protein [Bradyrhizobium sp. SZCCHNR1039]|uniref:helix-turn-helix domain-containing protein n=2 Tax=Bradyrhizobium TaxID=374 RepID=UPI003966C0AF